MQISDNLTVAEDFFAAFEKGDESKLLGLIHEDFTWIVPAPSLDLPPVKGEKAIKAVLAQIGNTLKAGTVRTNIVRTASQNETVVLEINITGETLNGKRYDNWYVHWLEFKDGLVIEWREHVDTMHAVKIMSS